jgi:4-alpha-glucanotransferase
MVMRIIASAASLRAQRRGLHRHTTTTTRGWYEALPEHERRHLWNYLQRQPADSQEATWELIRLAWSAPSALSIAPLQDVLALQSAARMNVPGRAEGQWRWRCTDEALTDASWQRLHDLTRASGRLPSPAVLP